MDLTERGGGEMGSLCDLCLRAPADATQMIQRIHIVAGHIICRFVEKRVFPQTGEPGCFPETSKQERR